uniref:Putative HNH endonuclease n=1 Tax=viral metagenome TaxID=1070528 RepID=A0A6M3L9U4_9ZZZZ
MPSCTSCKEEKHDSQFYIDKRRRNGLSSLCRRCHGVAQKKWYMKNEEKQKEYSKLWEEAHKEERKERNRIKYLSNSEYILERNRLWRKNNPEKIRELSKIASRKSRGIPKGRLNCSMSANLRIALKGNKAGRHWEDLVKFTVDQLKRHLERRFTNGMTWENYGTYWEIDHKVPISVFNFERPEDIDFRLCWSLKNLHPLEKTKNRRKSAKIEDQFQPSLALGIGG